MPPVSQAQRAAMYAAKEGKSTLGIPAKVGAEFVAADKGGNLPPTRKTSLPATVNAKKPVLRIGRKTYG